MKSKLFIETIPIIIKTWSSHNKACSSRSNKSMYCNKIQKHLFWRYWLLQL